MERSKVRSLLVNFTQIKRKQQYLDSLERKGYQKQAFISWSEMKDQNQVEGDSKPASSHSFSKELIGQEQKSQFGLNKSDTINPYSTFTPKKTRVKLSCFDHSFYSKIKKVVNVQNLNELGVQGFKTKRFSHEKKKRKYQTINQGHLYTEKSQERKSVAKRSPSRHYSDKFRRHQWKSRTNSNQYFKKSPIKKISPQKRKASDITPWDTHDESIYIE